MTMHRAEESAGIWADAQEKSPHAVWTHRLDNWHRSVGDQEAGSLGYVVKCTPILLKSDFFFLNAS